MISKSRNVFSPSLQAAIFAAKTSEYAKAAIVDDGAPFSAVGETELFAYLCRLAAGDVVFSKVPNELY